MLMFNICWILILLLVQIQTRRVEPPMDHLHDGEALDELKVQQQHVSDRTETSF